MTVLRTELIEQGKRTRSALLAAAAEEFGAHGYAAASLSAIGARAGKDKTALRHHFATKADLAVAVDDHQYAVWAPMVDAVTETGARGLPAVLALLSDAIDDSVAKPFARAVIRLRVGDLPAEVTLSEPAFSWFGTIESRMMQAREDGDLPDSVDPVAAARVLIDSSFGVHQLHFEPLDSTAAAQRFADHWRHILAGIGVRDPDGILESTRALRRLLREAPDHVDDELG